MLVRSCGNDLSRRCKQARAWGGREIQSENTDGYSVSYATEAEAGKIAVNSLQIKIYEVIQRYLAHTGLLYLGVE